MATVSELWDHFSHVINGAGEVPEGGDTEPLPLPGLNGHEPPPDSDVAVNAWEEGLPLPKMIFAPPADAPAPAEERGVRGHRTTGVRNIVEDDALPLPTMTFPKDGDE